MNTVSKISGTTTEHGYRIATALPQLGPTHVRATVSKLNAIVASSSEDEYLATKRLEELTSDIGTDQLYETFLTLLQSPKPSDRESFHNLALVFVEFGEAADVAILHEAIRQTLESPLASKQATHASVQSLSQLRSRVVRSLAKSIDRPPNAVVTLYERNAVRFLFRSLDFQQRELMFDASGASTTQTVELLDYVWDSNNQLGAFFKSLVHEMDGKRTNGLSRFKIRPPLNWRPEVSTPFLAPLSQAKPKAAEPFHKAFKKAFIKLVAPLSALFLALQLDVVEQKFQKIHLEKTFPELKYGELPTELPLFDLKPPYRAPPIVSIKQHALLDCWLIAGYAASISDPVKFGERIVPFEGGFKVNLHHPETLEEVSVFVENEAFYDGDKILAYTDSASQVPIIEMAVAKLMSEGSDAPIDRMNAITSDSAGKSLQIMTGERYVGVKPPKLNESKMVEYLSSGEPIALSISAPNFLSQEQREIFRKYDLSTYHSYSFVEVKWAPVLSLDAGMVSGGPVAVLYNPAGRFVDVPVSDLAVFHKMFIPEKLVNSRPASFQYALAPTLIRRQASTAEDPPQTQNQLGARYTKGRQLT